MKIANPWIVRVLKALGSLALLACLTVFVSAAELTKNYSINAGAAAPALRAFAEQSGRSVIFSSEKVEGIRTNEVKGEMTAPDALDQMLSGTRLVAVPDKSGAFSIRKEVTLEQAEKNVSSRPANSRAADDVQDGVVKLDTFEVFGRKTLNMDIARSRDDVQPYVVLDRQSIENSGAGTIEEFLSARLSMNQSTYQDGNQNPGSIGNVSSISLRSLGTNQTLILVDGRRLANVYNTGFPLQPDLNGIPLAAVDRIEVLPATASAIYGGSATGGVINIVLRRDYRGIEMKLTYENSFDTDSAIRRAELSAGFNLEGGKTSVLLSATWSDQNELWIQDRDFMARGRQAIAANNPNYFRTQSNPPLGATPNIRSTTNMPLFGPGTATFTSVPVGYAGGGGLAPFLPNAGIYNFHPAQGAQYNGVANGGRYALYNSPAIARTFGGSIRREFSDRFEAFVEGSLSERDGNYHLSTATTRFNVPAGAVGNPFGQTVRVTVPSAAGDHRVSYSHTDHRVIAGVIVKLAGEWQAEADYNWSGSTLRYPGNSVGLNTAAAMAAINSGALNVFRDTNLFPVDFAPYLVAIDGTSSPFRSRSTNATVRAAGPLPEVFGIMPTLSGLVEHREDEYDDGVQTSPGGDVYFPGKKQRIQSAYLEAKIAGQPRADGSENPGWEMQLAVRHDRYDIGGVAPIVFESDTPRFGNKLDSTNPSVGFKFSPVRDLALRASFGTGFLPPDSTQLAPILSTFPTVLVDPRRGNEDVFLAEGQLLSDGNPNLAPEKSRSWSAGAIFTPRALPALRVSVDWIKIEKTDNIGLPPLGFQGVVNNESLFPGRVERGPVALGDPFGVGPIVFLDSTLLNLASATVEAFDLGVDYRWTTAVWGTFEFFAMATHQPHAETQLVEGAPEVDSAGRSGFMKWRGSAGLNWKRRNFSIGWTVRYYDEYTQDAAFVTATLNQGNRPIPAQVYHDIHASYRFADASGRMNFLRGTEIRLGVKNVLNEEPPFDAATGISSYYSRLGDPRLAVYHCSIKRAF